MEHGIAYGSISHNFIPVSLNMVKNKSIEIRIKTLDRHENMMMMKVETSHLVNSCI